MQKYEMLGLIGEGAYGVVIKCKCNDNRQIVAIKKFEESQDDQFVKNTAMREVKIHKMLKHPNIVELKQAFRKKSIVYLVFEYVPNNLLEVLEKSPDGLDPETIRLIIYQLLKGLAYLHAQNIVHRDIKPENLLVGDRKQLKICDFGFARQLKKQSEDDLTDYVATRWYRPPQLLVGAKYGKEIDIWAVGCIFGQLIDGNPMFPGQNELDQLFLIQKCLGPLTPDHYQTFLKNPRFLGMKFVQINTLDTLQKRYLGKLNPKAMNFLKHLLKMNPLDRLTAIDALKHPYFDGVREQDLTRKLSSNNYIKNDQKIIYNKQQYNQQPIQQYKKQQINNQINQQYQKVQQVQQISLTKNVKMQINKSSRQDNNKNTTIKAFNPNIQTKSINKSKLGKFKQKQKQKQKNISLQKNINKDGNIKTQNGFYGGGTAVMHQKNQDQEIQYARNKIYNLKKQQLKKQNFINAQEVLQEEDQAAWQSTSQLPILMMGPHKTTQQKKPQIASPAMNIIITNSIFNYKNQ